MSTPCCATLWPVEPPLPPAEDRDKHWKKVFILMMVMCSLPALIIAIAFAIHEISVRH
jgi:hypothetical protein